MSNKTATLRIESIIGRRNPTDEFLGAAPNFSAQDMSDFIAANKGMKEMTLVLRTDGGNLDEAYDMRGQLRELKASGVKLITKGYRVNSAGTVLFIEGDERLVADPLQFTIHNARIPNIEGQPKEVLRLIADELEIVDNKILDTYSEVLGFTPGIKNEVKALMTSETDLGADLAIKFGFATGKIVEGNNTVGFTWTNKIAALVNNSNNNSIMPEAKEIKEEMNSFKSWFSGILKKAGLTVEATNETIPLKEEGKNLYAKAALAEGVEVFTDEAQTEKANGDYVLADGRTVTCTDGVVSKIMDAPTAKKKGDETADPKDAKIAELEGQLKDAISAKEKTDKEITDTKETLKEVVNKVNKFTTGKGFEAFLTQQSKEEGKEEKSKHSSLRSHF
jgi:ATP-dependent protease ClpP protease subunit